MTLAILVLFLLITLSQAGSIISNIPVIVSPNKNYTTSQPRWLSSPFFRAGNEAVIKTLTGKDKTPTYTFTFSSALPGLPSLAYGIKNYRGNDYLIQQFYEIKKIGLSPSTFTVSIQIYGITNLWLLTVAYLAVDPTFPHHLNTFDNVPINNTAGDIVNITSYRSYLTYYTNYINYTKQAQGSIFTKFTSPLSSNSIVLYMTSLWIRANYDPVQFHVYTGIVNESFYWWNVTLSLQALITNVHFSQIVFNTNDVESSNKYFIVYAKWYNNVNGGFIEIPFEFVDNFIMGVTSFESVDGACGFQYQWEFTNKTVSGVATFGVQLLDSWTLDGDCGFSWTESSIFYMQTWLCNAPYYYFNLTSSLCQTLCGGYTYENELTYSCDPCINTDCYQCNDPDKNICTGCASYLFFQLVDGDCVCMSGYFKTNGVCTPCNNGSTGCLLCTYEDGANGTLAYNSNLFKCTKCNNTLNYILNNNKCTLCTLSYCSSCLNLTACSTCSATYSLSVSLTCVKCYVTGCAYCSTSNPNACGVCNNTLGYYINSSNSCQTKCGDGIYVPATEQCDDNNTVSYDGCSSTCTIESSFTCSGSPSICYFASSATFSLLNTIMEPAICNTITFTFKITPTSAVFSQPNVVWDNFLVTPNSSLLTPNASMYKYSNGNLSASYFLQKSIQGQTLVFGTNFPSLIANSTIFANTISSTITFTVLPTNNLTAQFRCCSGYSYDSVSKSCKETCGDGLVYEVPCDDGNLINSDGCSSTCQIQTDYACINGSTNSPSVCFFNGSIAVTLNYGNKDPTSNSLSLSYTISPIQPILNLINNTYNFIPFVSLSNPNVVITSALYNPTTNTVDIQISYNQSIQGQPLNLILTPPNSTLPNITNNWVVNPTNHLSAVYYPQSTYDKVKKLQPYSSSLIAFYLSISFITFFFRKFLGLQLSTLMQIGYLSLLLNNEMPAQLQVVSTWPYVFGYNSYYLSRQTMQPIDQPYALYQYQRYFGYSCNVMLLCIVAVYGLSIVLFCLSAITVRNASKKLRNGAFFLINELGFTLVVFSTPNILTAIFIEAKEGTAFNNSVFWSSSFMLLGLSSLIISNIINLVNIQESNEVGTFFRKHSKIGVYCSVIFILRLFLLTLFIFLYQLMGTLCFFMLIGIQFLYLLLVLCGRPHKKPIDFLRGITVEISLLYILLTRYLEVSVFDRNIKERSNVESILSLIQLAAYGLSILLTIVSLIYHLVKKFQRNKVDPGKFEQQESPEKILNQSMGKIGFGRKQPNLDSRESRRKLQDSIVFDLQGITNEVYPSNSVKNSIKLDYYRKQQRRIRRNRR